MGTSVSLVTAFPNRHSILGGGRQLSTMMTSWGVHNGPAWDSSILTSCMQNSAVCVLLFHMVLLALASTGMLLYFHAFRGEKHPREDVVAFLSTVGLLLLKCLHCKGH